MFHEKPGFSGAFVSRDAEPVLDVLREILIGQELVDVPRAPADEGPMVEVARQRNGGWRITPVGGERAISFSDPVSAACCLSASLLKARMRQDQEVLCLHAAAVEIGGGLVLMPSVYRAGKSLLSVGLAASGCRLFNDDVVLLDPYSKEAIAPGLAPRLRLPLPATLDERSSDFIANHGGPRGAHYLYLKTPKDLHAAAGERAKVHGLVLLNRKEAGPAELTRIKPGPLLRQLVWQNFARTGSADRILSCLCDMISSSQCLALSYARIEDARQLLIDHFAGRDVCTRADMRVAIAGDETFEGKASEPLEICEDAVICGAQGVTLREHFGERFLINAENDRILHLNGTAAALWSLLEEPVTFQEVAEIFSLAFPDVGARRMKKDLQSLLTVMHRHDLITGMEMVCRPRNANSPCSLAF